MIPFIIAGAVGFGIAKLLEKDNTKKFAGGGKAGEIKDGDSVIMYFNQDTELEIFESEDLEEEPYIDVFKKGEKFEVDIFGVDDTIYDVQFGDGDVAFIPKNNVTIVSVNDKTFASGGEAGEKPMNYAQLLKQLKSLTKEQLQQTPTIYIESEDEYYAVSYTDITNEDDVLDEGHPFLVISDEEGNDEEKPMNYAQLLKGLKVLSKEQLQQTLTIYVERDDEYYAVSRTDLALEDDVLDEGHFFLVISNNSEEYAGGGKTGEIKDGDSVIMYFNQDTELEIFESEDLEEEPYIDVFKKGEKFEVDIFGVDDTIYDVQFGDGDVAFIPKNNVTIVSVNDKTFAKGGKTGLTKSEISIIDDRIEYYFDNEEYTDDSESLASFVIDGGEIDSSKYKEILQYIESQGYAGDDENDDDEYAGGGKTGEIKDGDSVIMYFNQDTELEIFESEDLDEEPYIDVFKKGEKFEVDIFGVDDTIYDVQFGDGDVAFIRKNNVTIVSVNDKTFASGGSVSKGYMVFNYTDNLYATYDVFKTKKLANDFIKEFRNRYSKQGYYRDNQMNKIDIKDIDLLAIPSDFNPLK